MAILGPTSIGKTALALKMAERFDGEIISADSRQVYRLLDIGTAKPSLEERSRVKHYAVDCVDPNQSYSVAQFLDDAHQALRLIRARGKVALVVGGTGYYAQTLLEGVKLPRIEIASERRLQIESEVALGRAAALQRLRSVDAGSAIRVDPNNPRRITRALEIVEATGKVPTLSSQPLPALVLGLDMNRSELYARADARIDRQISLGLVDEAKDVLALGYSPNLPVLRGLAYRQVIDYLRGRLSLDEAMERYRFATHRLIRRQLTWFRSQPRLQWLDAASTDLLEQVIDRIALWLADR